MLHSNRLCLSCAMPLDGCREIGVVRGIRLGQLCITSHYPLPNREVNLYPTMLQILLNMVAQ